MPRRSLDAPPDLVADSGKGISAVQGKRRTRTRPVGTQGRLLVGAMRSPSGREDERCPLSSVAERTIAFREPEPRPVRSRRLRPGTRSTLMSFVLVRRPEAVQVTASLGGCAFERLPRRAYVSPGRQAVWARLPAQPLRASCAARRRGAPGELGALEALGWLAVADRRTPAAYDDILAPVIPVENDTKRTAELRELILAAATDVEPHPRKPRSAVRRWRRATLAVDWDDRVRPRRRAVAHPRSRGSVQAEPSCIQSANGMFTVSTPCTRPGRVC